MSFGVLVRSTTVKVSRAARATLRSLGGSSEVVTWPGLRWFLRGDPSRGLAGERRTGWLSPPLDDAKPGRDILHQRGSGCCDQLLRGRSGARASCENSCETTYRQPLGGIPSRQGSRRTPIPDGIVGRGGKCPDRAGDTNGRSPSMNTRRLGYVVPSCLFPEAPAWHGRGLSLLQAFAMASPRFSSPVSERTRAS